MPTTDLHYLGLIEIGQQIQAKKLSPVEVTKAMLGRIEQLDGKLKSYAYVMGEAALAEAAAARRTSRPARSRDRSTACRSPSRICAGRRALRPRTA